MIAVSDGPTPPFLGGPDGDVCLVKGIGGLLALATSCCEKRDNLLC